MLSVYYIAKSDFLERIRSFTFLVVLGACMYLSYTFVPSPNAEYITVTLGNYRGLYNAAWIGTLVAMMSSVFLSLFGFYLVNNSVSRDFETGVGQIIATTQISKMQYLLGKALSNFMIFLSITLAVGVMAAIMLYLNLEEGAFNLWDLYSPFLWITLPAMFFIAALATFLESFRKVSKGLINIFYFFMFMIFIGYAQSQSIAENPSVGLSDLFGVNLSFEHMGLNLHQQVNDYNGKHSIGYLIKGDDTEFQTFIFHGIKPTFSFLLFRFWWVLLSIGLLAIGAFFFRRFDPTFDPKPKERKRNRLFRAQERIIQSVPFLQLSKPHFDYNFLILVYAEWKIMIQGASRWWWLITLGLFITSLFINIETAHEKMLLILWAWQILLWSTLGSREKQNNTEQIIFSSPNVLSRQLYAAWAASVLWALVLAFGVIIRLSVTGNSDAVLSIVSGGVFLPSLALFCGIYTGGAKLFQVIYLFMAYAVLQNVPYFDYLGAVDTSKNLNLAPIFFGLSIGMLFLTLLRRRSQVYV